MAHHADSMFIVQFAVGIEADERRDLVEALSRSGLPVRTGLDLGHRGAEDDDSTIAVVSMPADADADQIAENVVQSRSWLRAVDPEHRFRVDIVSRKYDAVVRISADDTEEIAELVHSVLMKFSDDPAEFAAEQHTGSPGHAQDGADSPAPSVLAIATEWLPARGGLSTLNRSLCAALSAAGATVYCMVPRATQEERQDATAKGVHLLEAAATPAGTERELLQRKPLLPPGVVPNIVIGHGRITGPIAMTQVDDFFPYAARVQFVHMAPDQIEWHKLDREDDAMTRADTRTTEERELGREAALVVPIGPVLHEWISRELYGCGSTATVVRLDPGFDSSLPVQRTVPPGKPQILVMGRMEDTQIKGVDIAARAIGHALRLNSDGASVELLVRGAPQSEGDQLRSLVMKLADSSRIRVIPRPYSVRAHELEYDLRRASLLLMPSREEGFGLVGLEAIVAGTPVLISANSGLGQLLLEPEVLPADLARQIVVPVTGDDETDRQVWGSRVAAALNSRDHAFAVAERVRVIMAQRRTWRQAATELLAALTS
ncbi:glycosyltransferase family 4 protein [Nocardia gamkensis]|uniref:glycosyltransferase family 4 protein n=1 Tax=Nocardia gamkensis TaxID=352869 RepID=UPI00340FDF34